MDETGICEGCGQLGPLQPNGYCSEPCRQEAALLESVRAGLAARQAWLRQELADLDPVAAHRRLWEILQAEEAQELAAGYRHLTVVHGYLEGDKDWELLERLLKAIRAACGGHNAHRTSQKHRLTLTVDPPDADKVVAGLAELARELGQEAAAAGGWRWQVFLLKYPREQW
jgi:hypothetical protein